MAMLNGSNYEQWYKSLMMNLALMKIDLALRIDAPSKPNDESSADAKKLYDEWDYSNRCYMLVMMCYMEEYICDSTPAVDTAKEFLYAIGKKFTTFAKFEKETYLNLLHSTLYDGARGVRDHVMKLCYYHQKLRALEGNLGEEFLVWLTMRNLPSQFDSIRSIYYAQKDWSVDEMIAILGKEEDDIKNGRSHAISRVTSPMHVDHKRKFSSKYTDSTNKFKEGGLSAKSYSQNEASSSNASEIRGFNGKCNFCHKFGHKKMDCMKFKAWKEKKGSGKQDYN